MARSETTYYVLAYSSVLNSQQSGMRGVTLAFWWMLLLSVSAAQPGPPSSSLKIVVLEGEGAINNIRQHHAKEPVVQILDESAPVNGASVTFLLPETGPSGAFEGGRTLTVLTNEKGQAVGRTLAPNQVAGTFEIRVVASYKGQTAKADITQINAQPGETAGGKASKKFLLLTLIGGAVAGGAAFAAMGHGGAGSPAPSASSPPPGNPQGTIIIPGTPVFQGPH